MGSKIRQTWFQILAQIVICYYLLCDLGNGLFISGFGV